MSKGDDGGLLTHTQPEIPVRDKRKAYILVLIEKQQKRCASLWILWWWFDVSPSPGWAPPLWVCRHTQRWSGLCHTGSPRLKIKVIRGAISWCNQLLILTSTLSYKYILLYFSPWLKRTKEIHKNRKFWFAYCAASEASTPCSEDQSWAFKATIFFRLLEVSASVAGSKRALEDTELLGYSVCAVPYTP